MPKPIYVSVSSNNGKDIRIGAQLDDTLNTVLVWIVGGSVLGWYHLWRFSGNRLTAKTLRELFSKDLTNA